MTKPQGTYCGHGHRVTEPDPADTGDYPRHRVVDPWPCGECTLEEFEEMQRAVIADYHRDLEREYWSIVGGCLW